jgi:CDP-glycerol glycerophosphotransferase (TagB/SpsB family)
LAWAFPRFASALGALARSYEVIGHGHPRVIDHLRPEYDLLGIKTAPSFEEVVTKADLFVADNTSALYEFAAMGRPVLCLEAEAWRKDAHHGLRFWDAIPGLSCSNPDDLVSMVTQALNDPLEAKELRRYALEVAYGPYLFGSATERAVEAIEKVVQGDLVGSG